MLELHPEAEKELDDAAAWYEHAREGLGFAFYDAVDALAALVEDFPEIGRPWSPRGVPPGVRRARLKRFPYRLIYVTHPRFVILAVAHERRRPGYWMPRLKEA
ncbi:MAG: type II toxin-antitoxin system RelE/ParE family toxin [Alphaproteobacteria bacterium]|nr:type II toxin-antitoxin system RelE/ParE family toxin [Alphaproteobacteria bacterium]